MSRFIIQGGRPIQGSFQPSGNKNGALPMLAACLLTDESLTLHNVPRILDVEIMLELLEGLGVEILREGSTVVLSARSVRATQPDPERCRKVRASILLAGPLVARHGEVSLSPPGGDVIGRRRIDAHFDGLRRLGIHIEAGSEFRLVRDTLRGTEILLDEASVTATENIVMAASLAEGETVLFHAACEPHVADLCELLGKMGAQISGHGTNRVCVGGVDRLAGAEHTIAPDYIEAGSFLAAAAVTGGRLTIEGIGESMACRVIGRGLQKLGVGWEWHGPDLVLPADQELCVEQDAPSAIPKIESGTWPGFPSDMMSVTIVVATQARGSVQFFEKMFESRMYFVDRLIEMGAHIVQCDPHRVMVQGAAPLQATHMSSPDIRAGMAMLVAALCAEGESTIDHAHVIDRGYEAVDQRLRSLGAEIRRVA